MSKVFKVTQSNQYIQTVALSKGAYIFQCNVKHHKDVLTIALKDDSNVWHEYEVPCKKNTWVDKAQLKFTTTVDMTAFSLCYKDASTQNPVYIEKPVLKMGAEIGVISPNYKDLIEELESSLVTNNGEGSLLNGLLDITELTNDKGSANLSLDVGKSILQKNVSLVKNKEGKDGNSPTVGANGNWHIGGVDTGIKAEGVSPHIGSNGNWYVGTVDTGVKAKGDKGDTGLAGQIPIQKEWVAGDTHRNNDEIVDYIYVRNIANPSLSNWYKLKSKGDIPSAIAPTNDGSNPDPSLYEDISWLKELAVNVLLAEEANVAGFIFKDNKLISEKGKVNGVDVNYGDHLTLEEREAFIPNLILDGTAGDVKITGTVNAKSGSIGVLGVDTSGEVNLEDPVTGEVKFKLNAGELPSLDVLLSNTLASGTATNWPFTLQYVPANEERSQILPNTITVTERGSEARLQCELTASCSDATEGAGNFTLYLLRNGVRYMDIATLQVSVLHTSEANSIDLTLNNLPKGTYGLEVVLTHYGILTDLKGTISASTLSWEFKVEGVQRLEIGLDGLMQFYTESHWYFTRNGFDLRGKTNMPGVLASGTVNANGEQSNTWGAKVSTDEASAVTGGRRVPLLSLEHDNYTVQITAHTSTTPFTVGYKTSTGFSALGTGAFDYTVIGSNY